MTLLIETSLQSYLVALITNDKVTNYVFEKSLLHKSDSLDGDVRELLKQSNLTAKTLSSIYVTKGPGSFMGIRAGIIYAHTLGNFLNIPVYSATSLEFLSATGQSEVYIDAKGGESYYQKFPNVKAKIVKFKENTNLNIEHFLSNTKMYLSKFKIDTRLEANYMKDPKVG